MPPLTRSRKKGALKSLFNRRCLWCCYRCFAAWAARVCQHFRPSVSSIAQIVFGRSSLFALHTRLSKHFSVVHSVVIVCAGNIRLVFKVLLKFRNVLNIPRAKAPLLVIKISKTTSPQRWIFSFALKRNETT